MLISKFDLYNREWLSLVFKNRNQQYGAYELRSHYDEVMARALGAMFLAVAAIGITVTVISRSKPVEPAPTLYRVVPVKLSDKIYQIQKPKELPKPKPAPAQQQAAKATPVSTQVFVAMKPVPDPVAVDPKPLDPNIAVGTVEVKVPGAGHSENADPGIETGTGTGDGAKLGPDVYNIGDEVQEMPTPMGGEAAWNKFLQKNLRYPGAAREQNVSGRVYVSFIVEKDGHLSSFNVERKGGYGFDEEALRVLKMAQAWKPGKQNGQPVRVRYIIPINFQLQENE